MPCPRAYGEPSTTTQIIPVTRHRFCWVYSCRANSGPFPGQVIHGPEFRLGEQRIVIYSGRGGLRGAVKCRINEARIFMCVCSIFRKGSSILAVECSCFLSGPDGGAIINTVMNMEGELAPGRRFLTILG
jgi:hypothetical protein